MEATHTQSQGTASSKAYDLDAMGLGPPTKVRRRGKVDKWTRILGVAVVLLLVFNLGVRLGHASRPKAAAPSGGAGAGAGGAGATANAGNGAGAVGAGAGAKAAATGTIKVIDGNTIYVSQPDGTTKKINVNDSTRFSRTVPAELRDLQPGDRVTVEGSSEKEGPVNAVRIDAQSSTLQQG